MGITTKNLVFVSLIILCILISPQSVFAQEDKEEDLEKTQTLVRDLICMLFWVMPTLALLFAVAGGVLIMSGSAENSALGKKFISTAISVLIIILALLLFVHLALSDVDIMVCFGEVPEKGNQPPIAEARVSYYENPTPSEKSVEVTLGDIAYFDGSLSKDLDGTIVRYIWDFDDGSYDEGTPIEHIYNATGEYYVKLRVDDDISVISPLPSTVRVIVNPPLDVRGDVIPYPPKTTTTSTSLPGGTTTTVPGGTTTTVPGGTTTTTVPNCLDIRTCPECIAAGCEWCLDPTMGPSHCTVSCALTCHGGDCYTVDCSFPVTTTTTTSTTTTLDIPCNDSYAYACKGYCNDSDEVCEIVTDHCECKEHITPCSQFKATGILPAKFSWRSWDGKNYLTPVRNQGSCGSCWAFSTVGCVEGTYKVEQWDPALNPDISEQHLVSTCCSCGDCGGCTFAAWAAGCSLSFVKNSGISWEACFPYVASNCICPCGACATYNTQVWKLSSHGSVSSNRDAIKEALICEGPLAVASKGWGHAIVLVGYDDGTKRWTIRNSWGPGWGSGGYGTIGYTGHSYSDIVNDAHYVDGVTSP